MIDDSIIIIHFCVLCSGTGHSLIQTQAVSQSHMEMEVHENTQPGQQHDRQRSAILGQNQRRASRHQHQHQERRKRMTKFVLFLMLVIPFSSIYRIIFPFEDGYYYFQRQLQLNHRKEHYLLYREDYYYQLANMIFSDLIESSRGEVDTTAAFLDLSLNHKKQEDQNNSMERKKNRGRSNRKKRNTNGIDKTQKRTNPLNLFNNLSFFNFNYRSKSMGEEQKAENNDEGSPSELISISIFQLYSWKLLLPWIFSLFFGFVFPLLHSYFFLPSSTQSPQHSYSDYQNIHHQSSIFSSYYQRIRQQERDPDQLSIQGVVEEANGEYNSEQNYTDLGGKYALCSRKRLRRLASLEYSFRNYSMVCTFFYVYATFVFLYENLTFCSFFQY